MTVAPELPPAPAARRDEVDLSVVPPPRAGRRRTPVRHPAGGVSRRPAAGAVRRDSRWTAGAATVVTRSATTRWSEPAEPGSGGLVRPGELVRLVAGPGVGTGREHRPAGPVRLRPAGARVVRPARPGLRLTRRAHVLLGLLAALAAAVAVIAASGRVEALDETAPVPASAPAEVVVAPGETLWSIAERIAPDRDPRGVVEQVRRLNGLPSGDVQAGQRLRLRAP